MSDHVSQHSQSTGYYQFSIAENTGRAVIDRFHDRGGNCNVRVDHDLHITFSTTNHETNVRVVAHNDFNNDAAFEVLRLVCAEINVVRLEYENVDSAWLPSPATIPNLRVLRLSVPNPSPHGLSRLGTFIRESPKLDSLELIGFRPESFTTSLRIASRSLTKLTLDCDDIPQYSDDVFLELPRLATLWLGGSLRVVTSKFEALEWLDAASITFDTPFDPRLIFPNLKKLRLYRATQWADLHRFVTTHTLIDLTIHDLVESPYTDEEGFAQFALALWNAKSVVLEPLSPLTERIIIHVLRMLNNQITRLDVTGPGQIIYNGRFQIPKTQYIRDALQIHGHQLCNLETLVIWEDIHPPTRIQTHGMLGLIGIGDKTTDALVHLMYPTLKATTTWLAKVTIPAHGLFMFGPNVRTVNLSVKPNPNQLRRLMCAPPWPDVEYDHVYRNRIPAFLQLFAAARPPLALARFLKRDSDNPIKTLVAEFLFGSDGECWDEVT
jgi:hypothetical protein